MEIDLSTICEECKAEGKHIIHIAYITDALNGNTLDPDGEWSWNILNHDRSIRFTWPRTFFSNQAAKDHLNGLISYME